jgi:hypothetical protein
MGLAMWMMNAGYIDGVLWYGLIGLGAYLAYVPFGCVLFDRLLAYTRFAGTAVFAIYLTDAIGYTGSVALQLFRDLIFSDTSRLEFFTNLTYAMSFGGAAALIAAMFYFLKQEPGQTSDLSGR